MSTIPEKYKIIVKLFLFLILPFTSIAMTSQIGGLYTKSKQTRFIINYVRWSILRYYSKLSTGLNKKVVSFTRKFTNRLKKIVLICEGGGRGT